MLAKRNVLKPFPDVLDMSNRCDRLTFAMDWIWSSKKKKNITSPSSLSLQYASHHTEYAPPSPVYGTTLFGMLERHSILRWLPKMAQWSSFVYS